MNEHAAAVRAGERAARAMLGLFGKVGTTEHPRGLVLQAYRTARQSLQEIVQRESIGLASDARDVVRRLRADVRQAVIALGGQAVQVGQTQAQTEADIYNLNIALQAQTPQVNAAVDAVLAAVDVQGTLVVSLIDAGGDLGLIIGDGEGGARLGMLQPQPITREIARWLEILSRAGYTGAVGEAATRTGSTFMRQAVAAIDERTTDCCLRVHGQTVGLEEDFMLTGVPRYADALRDPPFHWWCRTSVTLVRAQEADDELSRQMRDAALATLDFRAEVDEQISQVRETLASYGEATDSRVRKTDVKVIRELRLKLKRLMALRNREIHPADARSRPFQP